MNPMPAVIFEERLSIPRQAHELAGFRRWAHSGGFPEAGRIDFLGGVVEVDMSPEELHSQGAVKAAIAARLHEALVGGDLGEVFIDRARVTHPAAGLSVEPDVVGVLWSSLEAGRVRYVEGAKPGRHMEIEGAPDLVVEVVSDNSVGKDTERLPRLYAAAGVPELWIADARGEELRFDVLTLQSGAYRRSEPGSGGWLSSPGLGTGVRLSRARSRLGTWRYRLDLE
jgi:Uma2 family endonuclease